MVDRKVLKISRSIGSDQVYNFGPIEQWSELIFAIFTPRESLTYAILCVMTISDPNIRFEEIVKNIINNNSVIYFWILGRFTGPFRLLDSNSIDFGAHMGPIF